MRKPRNKLYPFAIYYTDGSYLIYDLTEKDYKALKEAITKGEPVELSVGFLTTKDVRAVIRQKETNATVAPVPEKPAVPELSVEEMQYLKQSLADIYDVEGVD